MLDEKMDKVAKGEKEQKNKKKEKKRTRKEEKKIIEMSLKSKVAKHWCIKIEN